ncbi:MAG: GDP-mannose 4,6-dehydratase, partial [Methanobacterium sp.]
MVKILVTGGAGFIGSNFVRYTLQKYDDYEITNLDALTYCGNLENLSGIEDDSNYTFINGDITDKELIFKITSDMDYIINFAAETHVDRSIEDPEIFIKSNVLGTQVLLEAAKKYNIKKYLQIS